VIDLTGHVALVTAPRAGSAVPARWPARPARLADVAVNYVSAVRRRRTWPAASQALGRARSCCAPTSVSAEDVESMAAAVAETFGRLDIWSRMRPPAASGPLLANTSSQLGAAMATNVEALLHLLSTLLPLLPPPPRRARGRTAPTRQGERALQHGARYALPNYGLVA